MADVRDEAAPSSTGGKVMFGRSPVLVDYEEVGDDNLLDALHDALTQFAVNRGQCLYLWNYYRGNQPVLDRAKEVRPEINNKIVENHAQEVVAFKVGYQLAEPLQYTLRNHDGTTGPEGGSDETETGYTRHLKDLNELNTLMFAADKASSDRDLFEHMCVCGVGYRMIEASADGDCPFSLHVLDPWDTFVARSSSYHRSPVMAVWVGRTQDGKGTPIYNVYTRKKWYLTDGKAVIDSRSHTYGGIPIVEYRLNSVRMGVFEPVLSLLDAINAIESNRLDGIEQTVQSLMKFVNCEVDETTFEAMVRLGAVKVSSPEGVRADVDFIRNDLDQTQTQVTKDDLYQAVVNICGMPNRQAGGGSTSDTGAAVLLRDGWTLAESHAKNYELQFKRAEKELLALVLGVCEQSREVSVDLRLRDIELAFNRRNYENVQVKSQVLTTMLANDRIHPELAFKSCGMFTDPEAAYLQSKRWASECAEETPQAPSADGGEGAGEAPSAPGVPQPEKGGDAGEHSLANA